MDILRYFKGDWRTPEAMLILTSIAMPLSMATWMALINNFAIERAGFTAIEWGFLQSLREIPGFLAFGVVLVLLLVREQKLALISLLLLGIGTAFTGAFPSVFGLYAMTVLMSIGFHYYETVRQSLALQWIDKKETPHFLGQIIATGSFASLIAFALIWLVLTLAGFTMEMVLAIGGGITILITLFCWLAFPKFPEKVEQHRKLYLRGRYWLYYLITFAAGSRRQIVVVFASLLMIEKFGFSPADITLMLLVNGVFTMYLAPKIGKLISHWGERRVLTLEYIGLIGVFTAYAFVDTAWIAVVLYVVDHLFFSMAIAIKTYFQKIADPADMASQAGVAFSINHVGAVIIPASLGFLWLISPAYVFLFGSGIAVISLILVRLIPENPGFENVALIGRYKAAVSPAE